MDTRVHTHTHTHTHKHILIHICLHIGIGATLAGDAIMYHLYTGLAKIDPGCRKLGSISRLVFRPHQHMADHMTRT